ncbi:MAG TPA: hypothetical protein VJL39_01275 [Candidatus Paceibacterota bacterium]
MHRFALSALALIALALSTVAPAEAQYYGRRQWGGNQGYSQQHWNYRRQAPPRYTYRNYYHRSYPRFYYAQPRYYYPQPYYYNYGWTYYCCW